MIAGLVSLFACGPGQTEKKDADKDQQEVMQKDEQTTPESDEMKDEQDESTMDTTGQMPEESDAEEAKTE